MVLVFDESPPSWSVEGGGITKKIDLYALKQVLWESIKIGQFTALEACQLVLKRHFEFMNGNSE